MLARLLTALVGLPLLVAAIWYGNAWLTPLVALIACLGLWEFYRLASRSGASPPLGFGILWSLAIVANGYLEGAYTLPVMSGGVLLSLLWLLGRRNPVGALTTWGYTLAGPLYIAWTLSHGLLLRELDLGREWLLLALLTTFATDSAAFLVGRPLGRHKLSPSLSPKKTWEGAGAGLLGAVAAAVALALLLKLPLSLWGAGLLGATLGVLTQAGDLAESLLKRSAGATEAGWLLPGHGGFLDRLDSVVFTIPFMYYVVAWMVR